MTKYEMINNYNDMMKEKDFLKVIKRYNKEDDKMNKANIELPEKYVQYSFNNDIDLLIFVRSLKEMKALGSVIFLTSNDATIDLTALLLENTVTVHTKNNIRKFDIYLNYDESLISELANNTDLKNYNENNAKVIYSSNLNNSKVREAI